MKIHFVCHGNLFRSIIAEAYLKSLELKDVSAFSSGTAVNWEDQSERAIYGNTLTLLKKHNLEKCMKRVPEQLNQGRVDNGDLMICVNSIVLEEAKAIVRVPANSKVWQVTDIGEGSRVDPQKIREYEDEIFEEIKSNVDILISELIQ